MVALRYVVMVLAGLAVYSGCGREDKPAKKPAPPARPARVERTTPLPELKPADDRDAADYAGLLLASDRTAGWTKTEPVRGAAGTGPFVGELAAVLAPYRPVRTARATYQAYHDRAVERVEATIIEAPSTADAYGMLSVACPGEDMIKLANVYRQMGPEAICILRGKYLGLFKARTTGQDKDHLVKGLELLAGKIMFELPGRGGPPMLVSIFQSEQLPAARTFFLRDLASLRGPGGEGLVDEIGLADPKRMTKLLELGEDVEFALAAFEVKDWPGRDVVWLARYPTAQQARRVYAAYRKVLDGRSSTDALGNNTIIKPARRRFLLGCWTKEAESLALLTKAIEQHLPQ